MDVRGLHRFLFEGLPVRGAVVRVTSGWQEALRRRAMVGAFAPPVRALIGEMTAAGMLMQSTIKFDGALILQVHGDGPVKLAVAEVKSDLSFRATAKVVAEVPATARLPELANVNGGGRCAITLDARSRAPGVQPYQGVVPLYGDQRESLENFSAVIEHYMLQSEQLDTRMMLAANDEVVAGLLLQRMPAAGLGNLAHGRDESMIGLDEDFNRLALLADTLTRDELLGLDVETLLRRLFWAEKLQRFEALPTRFRCSCGRQRVQQMLLGLGRAEIDEILAERSLVEIGCDFCGAQYHFDAVDVGELFTPPLSHPPSTTTLQ